MNTLNVNGKSVTVDVPDDTRLPSTLRDVLGMTVYEVRVPDGEGHAQILIEAREALDLVLAVVLDDATTKRAQRRVLRQLCENKSALVHQRSRRRKSSQGRRYHDWSSNRDQRET